MSITCILEERVFLQLLYFWRFVSRFFSDRVKKLVICSGLHESSLDFQRREDQKIPFMRSKFIYLYLDFNIFSIFNLICQTVNLSWKIAVQNVFSLIFVADTKIISDYNFVASSIICDLTLLIERSFSLIIYQIVDPYSCNFTDISC